MFLSSKFVRSIVHWCHRSFVWWCRSLCRSGVRDHRDSLSTWMSVRKIRFR
jgi:hypothetical protein